jgi:hypothetical protein
MEPSTVDLGSTVDTAAGVVPVVDEGQVVTVDAARPAVRPGSGLVPIPVETFTRVNPLTVNTGAVR